MRVADYIAQFLEAQGVEHVFEVVGGMITLMVDSIYRRGTIKLVSVHHEQAAAFAAEASGRITGIPGVAMATSGPGATNLLTGIGSCYFDSTPAVFITGQVNRHELKGDRDIRQLGFQETDIVSIAEPVTKKAWRVTDPADIPAILTEAFRLALEGRPGPVLIDVPMDVQQAHIDVSGPARVLFEPDTTFDASIIDDLLSQIRNAERPMILAGGGIRSAQAVAEFRSLVEQLQVPVIYSLMGVDALPADNPLRIGMLGSYGNRWTNLSLARADFLLVMGSRLDIRQTGAQTAGFKGERTIFHVDCESGELNNRVVGCQTVVAQLRPFITAVSSAMSQQPAMPKREAWMTEIEALKTQWPDTGEQVGITGINPNQFMHDLSRVSGAASAYVIDVGQHQMWAAQSLEPGADQRFMTSGGMGAMGFALPAAIGTAISAPERSVIMIAGDGGVQLNIQELQTIVRNNLPVKLVILNNNCHGMVRQFQQSYMDERYQSTLWGYSAPDFTQVARAYGIEARTVSEPNDVAAGLADLWQDPQKPFLLQVMIDTYANAYPKLAFGHGITEMEPFVKPVAMEST